MRVVITSFWGAQLLTFAVACGGNAPPAAEPDGSGALKLKPSAPPATGAKAAPPAPVAGAVLPVVGPAVANKLVPSVVAGGCVIQPGGELRCPRGEADRPAPPGPFFSIEYSKNIYCGVRVDQSAVCWSNGGSKVEPITLPQGKFAALFLEGSGDVRHAHFCGIRPGGDAECWSMTPGQGTSTVLRPAKKVAGPFVQALVSSFSSKLLKASGEITLVEGTWQVPATIKHGGGNFTEIGPSHRVRSDGAYIDSWWGSDRVVPGAFVSGDGPCVLARDGSVSCRDRRGGVREAPPTFFPGPFVQVKGGCGVRLDGRLKSLSGACPAATVAQVPDVLRSRIEVPSESLAVAHFNRLERLRASEGTAREYRVSLGSPSESHYLSADRRGAVLRAVPHDIRGTDLLDEDSDLVLVDINGGELQFGDPAYIKRGGRYLAPSAGAQQRVELLAQASPRARWAVHAFDRNVEADAVFPPVRRGLINVLLRALATGDFLLPCPAHECADPPARSGVRPAGVRDDIGPWWVKDPYWSDVDESDEGRFLTAGWNVTALVDCPGIHPWTREKEAFRCGSISDE